MSFTYDTYCFACGENNPQGLKLKFKLDGEKVSTVFVPAEVHQGYPGILHGGITSTVLDDIMSRCVNNLGLIGVTARLEVRFRRSIPIGTPLFVEAWITKKKGPLVETQACMMTEDGEVAAEGKASFMTSTNKIQEVQTDDEHEPGRSTDTAKETY